MKQQRICVYPSDVALLFGRSDRYGRELLRKLRETIGKEPRQPISYCEFAEYVGLKPEAVFKAINNVPVLEEE